MTLQGFFFFLEGWGETAVARGLWRRLYLLAVIVPQSRFVFPS